MEIYPAIQFLEVLSKGASTRPWRVELLNPSKQLESFVVKIFTPNQIYQQNAVAKETYGNLLARTFNLPVPECVLVRFTSEFIETLPEYVQEQHELSHKGLKFASRHHEGYTIIGNQLPNSKIRDYDMDSVYAFDNLIWNLDRGGERNKPNLLIKDEDYLLIDHELIFPFADDPDAPNEAIIHDFKQGKWRYPYAKHLFYPYLKKMQAAKKAELFDTFAKQLSTFDPYILEEVARFLAENGHPIGAVDFISEYLWTIKSAPDKFVTILKQQLV